MGTRVGTIDEEDYGAALKNLKSSKNSGWCGNDEDREGTSQEGGRKAFFFLVSTPS